MGGGIFSFPVHANHLRPVRGGFLFWEGPDDVAGTAPGVPPGAQLPWKATLTKDIFWVSFKVDFKGPFSWGGW